MERSGRFISLRILADCSRSFDASANTSSSRTLILTNEALDVCIVYDFADTTEPRIVISLESTISMLGSSFPHTSVMCAHRVSWTISVASSTRISTHEQSCTVMRAHVPTTRTEQMRLRNFPVAEHCDMFTTWPAFCAADRSISTASSRWCAHVQTLPLHDSTGSCIASASSAIRRSFFAISTLSMYASSTMFSRSTSSCSSCSSASCSGVANSSCSSCLACQSTEADSVDSISYCFSSSI
mmetsp:Transcript_6223/g.14352  ORF Transcript_6223/g.14352 Transcript_6223/m.14352 type:complete len:241 (+) Transcript_6223:284-1006(+)